MLDSLFFLIYPNDMPMAVKCNIFFYANDTCLGFQSQNVNDINKQLHQSFAYLCDWFVDKRYMFTKMIESNFSFLLQNVRSKRFPG